MMLINRKKSSKKLKKNENGSLYFIADPGKRCWLVLMSLDIICTLCIETWLCFPQL